MTRMLHMQEVVCTLCREVESEGVEMDGRTDTDKAGIWGQMIWCQSQSRRADNLTGSSFRHEINNL